MGATNILSNEITKIREIYRISTVAMKNYKTFAYTLKSKHCMNYRLTSATTPGLKNHALKLHSFNLDVEIT